MTTLYSFARTVGAYPNAGLIQGVDGEFYGTTEYGVANDDGTVFNITSSGALTTLHSFDKSDGANVTGGLVQAIDGNFYGTTANGGNESCTSGCGTVFTITSSGVLTTLHRFDGTDGDTVLAGLIQGADGNLYGTTYHGGAHGVVGTVFKITTGGSLTTLHEFDGTDGADPEAALVQATDGNSYGTTSNGGVKHGGTIFEITPSGALTSLHSFHAGDGDLPAGSLVQDTNGTLYRTTYYGGANGGDDGTIFSLSVGLGPFVSPQPASGNVGAAVTILGTNLTGATNITFNGTPATFTVKLRSEITTTVPTGATTGTVQVVTPGGTLSSNVSFQVLP